MHWSSTLKRADLLLYIIQHSHLVAVTVMTRRTVQIWVCLDSEALNLFVSRFFCNI